MKHSKFYQKQNLPEELIFQEVGQDYFSFAYMMLKESINQISEFAKKKNIPYLVVIVPARMQIDPEGWEVKEIQTTDIPQQRIKEICADTHYAFCLDLLPVFRSQGHRMPLYYKNDLHWTPLGHQLAAQEVFKFLQEKHLIKIDRSTGN